MNFRHFGNFMPILRAVSAIIDRESGGRALHRPKMTALLIYDFGRPSRNTTTQGMGLWRA
jgi:hypothetical protein